MERRDAQIQPLVFHLYSAIMLWWGLLAETARPEGPFWATGRALQEQLAAPVSLIWEGNPLRPAIMNLSRTGHVAILIDRRVDPGQSCTPLKQVPLESAVKAIADDRELGVCRLPWGLYLGPPAAAERFEAVRAALAAGIRRLPTTVQSAISSIESTRLGGPCYPRADCSRTLPAKMASKSRTYTRFRTTCGRPKACRPCRWAIGCWRSRSNTT